MLVRFGGDWYFDDMEELEEQDLHLGAGLSLEFNSLSTTPLPSDDIWKKFDLPDTPMTDWWNTPAREADDYNELNNLIEQCNSAASAMSSTFWAHLDPPCSGKEMREIRHHDCMWAGHCVNKEHDRTFKQSATSKTSCSVKQDVSTRTTTACTQNVRTVKTNNSGNPSSASLLVNKNNSSVVKSNNSRSLLLSSRTNVNSRVDHSPVGNRYQRQSLESDGDSPRPETPQSLSESEEEDDHPRFRHSLGGVLRSSVAVCDSAPADFFFHSITSEKKPSTPDDEDVCSNSQLAVPVTEVTGQVCRPVEKPQPVVKTEKTDAFYSDHSYHLSKGSVKMENLGVETPSDSEEEEIDVVSVGEKQTGGRGGVGGSTTLPTNPSARDRQQLQLTVASAISAASRQPPNSIPMRITIGDRTVSVRTVPADSLVDTDKKRKCGSSRGSSKGVKRTKYQYHHRLAHKSSRRGNSRVTSDSEPDSCEKRSLHNDMERQRRIDLRNLVEGLRVLVPEVQEKKRAAKVVILKEAAAYCHKLRDQSKSLSSQVTDLQREQERLRARVSQLRRQVAAQR